MMDQDNVNQTLSWCTGGGYDYANTSNPYSPYAFPAGSAFWLILRQDAVINTDGIITNGSTTTNIRASLVTQDQAFELPIYKGWNMVGNPFNKQVAWSSALFQYRGEIKSLSEAAAAGWISSSIYSYTESPTRGYTRVSNRDMLQPYTGYWVYSKVGGVSSTDALTMIILP